MLGWTCFAAAALLLVLASRGSTRSGRRIGQGAAVLLAAIGALLLARRPGTAFPLPGQRPRPWYTP